MGRTDMSKTLNAYRMWVVPLLTNPYTIWIHFDRYLYFFYYFFHFLFLLTPGLWSVISKSLRFYVNIPSSNCRTLSLETSRTSFLLSFSSNTIEYTPPRKSLRLHARTTENNFHRKLKRVQMSQYVDEGKSDMKNFVMWANKNQTDQFHRFQKITC